MNLMNATTISVETVTEDTVAEAPEAVAVAAVAAHVGNHRYNESWVHTNFNNWLVPDFSNTHSSGLSS